MDPQSTLWEPLQAQHDTFKQQLAFLPTDLPSLWSRCDSVDCLAQGIANVPLSAGRKQMARILCTVLPYSFCGTALCWSQSITECDVSELSQIPFTYYITVVHYNGVRGISYVVSLFARNMCSLSMCAVITVHNLRLKTVGLVTFRLGYMWLHCPLNM